MDEIVEAATSCYKIRCYDSYISMHCVHCKCIDLNVKELFISLMKLTYVHIYTNACEIDLSGSKFTYSICKSQNRFDCFFDKKKKIFHWIEHIFSCYKIAHFLFDTFHVNNVNIERKNIRINELMYHSTFWYE